MTDDNVINVALQLEADERSAKKAEQQVNKIIKALEKLQKTTKDPIQRANIQKSIDLYKKEGVEIIKANEELAKREAIQKKQIALLEKSIAKRQKGEQTALQLADERFSQTSRQVALAGDVESGARTVGGALGAFGATGAERGIAQVSEIPAVIEALPRLKVAFQGLPQTISAAAGAIGIGGGLAAAGLIGGLFLLTEAFKSSAKAARETAEAQQNRIDRLLEADEISFKSTEELLSLQQQYNETIAVSEQQLKTTTTELGRVNEAYDGTFSSMRETAVQGVTTQKELDEVNDELETSQSNLSAVNAELEKRNDLDTGAVDKAREIGDLRRLEVDALDRTAEANRDRLKDLQTDRSILEEQIASLRASGDTSKRAQEELKNLEAQLRRVGQESGIVSQALANQASTAVSETVQSNNKISDLRRRLSDAEHQEIRQRGAAASEARKKRNDAILKLQSDGLRKRAKLINDAQRAEREAQKNFLRERDKFAADQDIKALFELAQSEEDAAQKRAEDFKQKQADLADSLKEERKKLLTETKVKARAGSTQVANLQRQLQAEIRAKNEAAKAAVNLEIEKGKAVVDINKSIAEQIVMLFRQITNIAPNINNAQSLTINGQTLPLNPQQMGGIEQSVLNILTQAGVV
jgi:hypothetical protein